METIRIDIVPGKKMPSLHASQYDDGREHGIDLFENGIAYKLDGTETLTINERKGDNCICSLDIVNTFAESNHIVFASTEQMCAVWGNNLCELVIAKGDVSIGTLNFILEIEPSPTENGIESESEIRNLARQVEEITEQAIGDNYYTKTQTDDLLADKANSADVYTKTEADAEFYDKDYLNGIFNQIDNAFTQVDNNKADKSNTYTKTQVDSEISRLDGRIDNLPEAMVFKGTLGVGGTIETLPTASAENEGWTYKVITAGTYAGQYADIGDCFTCYESSENVFSWTISSKGDTDTDTWRNIKVNGVEKLGNGISSGAVDFVGSDNIEIEYDGDGKIKTKTKNIYTKEEVDDIVYNILPDDTASGSVANFETDLALPIKSLEIDVNAKQDLHGYDYPWPAGGGKNLIDNADFFSYSSWETDLVTVGDFSTSISNRGYALPTISGETYTISFGIDASNIPPYVYLCKSDGETSTRVAYITTGSSLFNRTYTFTADGSLYYLRSGSMSNESSFNTQIGKISYVQLEKGSTATEYAPYENICPIEGWSAITSDVNGTTEVITLGGTYYGGHLTQDKDGHRQFEATHGIVLIPDLTLSYSNNSGNWENYLFYGLVSGKSRGKAVKCSNYEPVTGVLERNLPNEKLLAPTWNDYIYIRDDNYTDMPTFKTANANTQLWYELAEPFTVALPDGEPIITINGTNNIYADTGNTSVVFKNSVNGYVEKQIANVQALALNT